MKRMLPLALLFVCMVASAISLPAGTKLTANVAYGPDPLQEIDVYSPSGAKNAPVILMVHGGGWTEGDKTNPDVVQNKVNHFLPEGIVFVSVNYRLSPQVGVMDEAADVAKALAYVQQHAAQWGADPSRVIVMGHSAGAHLTSLVSVASDIQKSAGVKPWLGNVELDSAAYNVVQIMEHPHADSLYDPIFGTDKNLWNEASPTLRIESTPPPMLLVCSTDHDNDCQQTQDFADAAHAQAYPINLDHPDINNDVGLPGPLTDKVDAFLCGLKVGCAPPPPPRFPHLCNWFGFGC